MYRLGTAELNGSVGLSKKPKEGVKWLKRSAEHATEEYPHALHELALLHERGIDNILFVDNDYAAELLAQAAELGYAPSAFKLGECYEYGKMGCPQDAALSIHYYVGPRAFVHPRGQNADSTLCRTEHCRSARPPGRMFRSHSVVSRRLTGRPSAIRHRGVPVGQKGRRDGPRQSPVRRGILHRGVSRTLP
jgi:hypothetical protein